MKNVKKMLWMVLLIMSQSLMAEGKPLYFGVVPQQAASKLARLWVPILQHVSKETGLDIRFKTATNIPVFEQRLSKGEYDLAYMSPYHYVVFHQKLGYKAFAKQMNKHIKGIVVVHKDSDINDIKQLQGATLAFPSPAAFAASILPRGYMKSQGIDIKAKYVSSHDSVYFNVAKKIYPAGGGIMRTIKSINPKILSQLKILWVSAPYTPHAFAARTDLPENTMNQIRESFIGLNKTEAGRKLLAGLNFSGVESAFDKDWDDVRKLNLDDLDNYLSDSVVNH